MATITASLPSAAYAEEWPAYKSGLSYVLAFGPKQHPVFTLLVALISLMLVIVAAIAILVVFGTLRRHATAQSPAEVPPARSGHGLSFIYAGSAVTILLLTGIASWTYSVLAGVSWPGRPPTDTALTIRVTGHQWWWEFHYVSDQPDRSFTTANEMHIPVGKPVRVELDTADVIHSFWVPALAGKTDTIPGQNNTTWIEAEAPGIYRGQCTEYCGLQHAHMGFVTIADPPDQFDAWREHQLMGPDLPLEDPERNQVLEGQSAFLQHCAVCHAVRGTPAGGRLGPDLSHLMQRRTIAAATLPNTIGYLSGWVASPQHVKPGNYMPTLALSGPELTQIRIFLATLK